MAFDLADPSSARTLGTSSAAEAEARRPAAATSLPWNITVRSLHPPVEHAAFALRRRLVSGLLVLGFLALAASYLIVRAVSRELAVARLQSDFVAAVSRTSSGRR